MATSRSADEVRRHYELSMGPDLGAAFHRLWNDLAVLHLTWSEYRSVFGTSEARIVLMNRAASGFLGIVEDVLWNDVVLRIYRFTDRTKSRETLSLRYLLPLIVDYKTRLEVIRLIEVAEAKGGFARDWRNRLLAHRDLQLALTPEVRPLDPASREGAQDAIDAITNVLGHVERQFCGSEPTMFEHISQLGNGEALLRVLRDGIEARDAAVNRLGTGEVDGTFFTRPLP